MTNLLPPLASAHHQRWLRAGELFARLPQTGESGATLPLCVVAAAAVVSVKAAVNSVAASDLNLPEIPAPLQPPAAPRAITAIDLKTWRADGFFRALTWQRAGLQPVALWLPAEQAADEELAPVTTERFFARDVPWAGPKTAPGAPLADRQIGAGLDLKFLLTAATAQAVQTSRRSRAASAKGTHLEADLGQAATFFRQLNWSTRGAKAD